MRICLVNLRALPALSEQHKHHRLGGEEVQHALLAEALARRGHDVRLVVADFGQEDGAVYSEVTTLKAYDEGAGVPGLRFVHPRWTGLWSAIKRANADVYYYSCAGMSLGLLAMFCKLYDRRLVFRVASDSDCDPRRVEIRHARDRWLYRYGLLRSDAVLVQTVKQQKALQSNYGLQSTVARMLVSRPLESTPANAKDIDVLWVANIKQIKRPDRLLDLARALPGVRFHMAGAEMPGEGDLYRRIEAEARALPNVTFYGAIPYLDIGGLFDRARVFANTSELEGFPNTYLQAWVRGIPVVATFDPDGVIDSVKLGSAHTSVSGMVEGLQKLLISDSSYLHASRAAIEYMRLHFDESAVLEPYLAAIFGADEPARAAASVS